METYKVDIQRLNETEQTIFSMRNIDVVLCYYWNSHGTLVEWNNSDGNFKEELHANDVKIVFKKYDLLIEEVLIHHSFSEAIIDGKVIPALDVAYMRRKGVIYIDVIVGAG